MKRALLLIALAIAMLFTVSSCDIDVSIRATAQAEIYYPNGSTFVTPAMTFGPFTHRTLTQNQLRGMFEDVCRGANMDFISADFTVDLRDEITHKHLQTTLYGVSFNNITGEFDFAELKVTY
ncbi:MAG: hypothetical protein J6Y31_01105 [Bacteroidales bacterium]|nr:hypothetical protein [Bacteroidales bacterium]